MKLTKKPKNADKNDDLEYSDSLKMDFTKLDINSKNHGEYNFFHIKNVLLQNINFGGFLFSFFFSAF
ncbi:unnamed protein product [Rhizophagus irregularis]|nr:unnamed protein product [Rhizophagus irregularis]